MAWVTPPTVSTGDTITATQWNNLANDLNETAPGKVTTKGDIIAATGANEVARVAVGANGAGLVADSTQSAGVAWLLPQYVSANRTANQSISTGTDTAIQLTAADSFDSNGLHDPATNNTRLTASVAGKYLVAGEITFAANTGGTQRYARIRKNGSSTQATCRDSQAPASGVTPTVQVVAFVQLAASDYVELMAYQDSGGALNVTDAKFSMTLLGTA